MIDDERFARLFSNETRVDLMRAQLAALDAYDRWLKSGTMDGASLKCMANDLIKATVDAQLTLLKASGQSGESLRSFQQDWVDACRRHLEAAIRDHEPGGQKD